MTLLFFLASIDLLFMNYSWNSLRTKGASVLIVFGLEVYAQHVYNMYMCTLCMYMYNVQCIVVALNPFYYTTPEFRVYNYTS